MGVGAIKSILTFFKLPISRISPDMTEILLTGLNQPIKGLLTLTKPDGQTNICLAA